LKLLLEKRFALSGLQYGRIASSVMFDGQADGVLLIGDEALRVKMEGLKSFSTVLDLGESWFEWQGCPFVFARWAVRRSLADKHKKTVYERLQNSLQSIEKKLSEISELEAIRCRMGAETIRNYWRGFAYRLSDAHEESIKRFTNLLEIPCLIA
jgi:chorismate dehydratase